MPNTLDNSTIPANDRFLTQEGLVSRAWINFLLWIKKMIVALGHGPQQMTQAQIAATKATLGNNDVGYTIWVLEFQHLLRWSGTAFDFAPGTERSNWYATFEPTGPLPGAGSGWVLGDGVTPHNVLVGTGAVTSVIPAAGANLYFRI